MKKGVIFKVFVYFLSVSFLLLMNEFPRMIAEASQNIPVAQMVSRGGVKFEVKSNLWEKVETPFPLFEGMKIRTEKGEASLALGERTRIEIGSDSLFHFGQREEFHLHQGRINFTIQPDLPFRFKVGSLWIAKSYPLQSAKGSPVALTKDRAFSGSVSMHSKGSVTVKSVQGLISVTNEEGALLASLSAGESITLPSVVASSKSPVMLANAEPGKTKGLLESEEEGLSSKWETWAGIGSAIGVLAVTVGVVAWASNRDDDDDEGPACP